MKITDIILENINELKTDTLKSYVNKRLARNPNVMSPNASGKTLKHRAGVDLAMDKIIPTSAIRKPKVAPQENVEIIPEADKTDTVTMDVPLLLRMMEYAREDAKTDMDLHDVAEKMIELSKHHDYLCMDNYNEITGGAEHDNVDEDLANWTDTHWNQYQQRYNARQVALDKSKTEPQYKITAPTGANPKEKSENAIIAGLNTLSPEDKARYSGSSFSASGINYIWKIGQDGTIYILPPPTGNTSMMGFQEKVNSVKYIVNRGGGVGIKVVGLYYDQNRNIRELTTQKIIVPAAQVTGMNQQAGQEKQTLLSKIKSVLTGESIEESCPHCGGLILPESRIDEKKDACYYKVKSRYKVWPSAYASGALVKCRKAGSKNWGNKSK